MPKNWQHIYRLRPFYRNVGWACTLLFLGFGITANLTLFIYNTTPIAHPILAFLFFNTIIGGFTVMGIVLLLAYYRARLSLNE